MVTGILITIFAGSVGIAFDLLGLLPFSNSPLPSGFSSGMQFILSYSEGWDWILPVSDSKLMIKWSIFVWMGIFVYKSIKWILRMIRGN